ncbi:HlyD family secretion protein [Hyalangium minutum]|uniref:Membrane fusion component of tripartite multidrug resistance system n=1 Tax=Hyalangium minutum TaxID=394096 RepID=A0A085WRZ0_9BACT|nr:HlyD family secretion protein [Hyalangium minutum]KFE70453.1 Membrane fusion component of tripartite multidrug resistance system [Hyalangium minutum]
MSSDSTVSQPLPAPTPLPKAPSASGEAAQKAAKGRRAFLVLGGVAALVLVSIGGYALLTHGQETTDDAQIEADVVPISSRVAGAVLTVHVKDNQTVKAGDVLVELDPVDLQARLAQAQAELATAKAQADAARAQEQVAASSAKGGLHSAKAVLSGSSVAVSSADAQVAAAQAALDRSQAEAHRTELDLTRFRQLREAGAISQQQLDNAQAAYDSAQAALLQARANLTAAQESKRAAISKVAEAEGRVAQTENVDAQVAAAHASTELAEARVRAAEAAVALAENQVRYTHIVAPADGIVSKLGVHTGQLVNLGTPVAELVPAQTYVVANFKETQIGGMHPGDHVKVAIDAFPGHDLEGSVESLSAGTGARFSLLPPDNASGNFVKVVQRVPVRIAWKSPPDVPLRAGLSAEVTVYVGKNGQ